MFDLIIANPPYGKSGSKSKEILNKIRTIFPQTPISVICPIESYRDCFRNVNPETCVYYENASEIFSDASGTNVTVAFIENKKVNKIEDFESFRESVVYNGNQLALKRAVERYNENREPQYSAKDNIISGTKGYYKEFYEKYFDRIFLITWRNVGDGVHNKDGKDYEHNILHQKVKPVNDSANGLIFKTVEERDNFAKWWYSCNERRSGKDRIGLVNYILDLLGLMSHGGVDSWYPKYFPNLDWSRSWTDEGIIAELKEKAGLPKDWEI